MKRRALLAALVSVPAAAAVISGVTSQEVTGETLPAATAAPSFVPVLIDGVTRYIPVYA